jgi:hypothetical protein
MDALALASLSWRDQMMLFQGATGQGHSSHAVAFLRLPHGRADRTSGGLIEDSSS